MSNYQEETIAGAITIWQRARQIVCDNPTEGVPSITIYEHEATRLPDGSVIEKSLGNLSYAMTDPTIEIPLIDPATFEQTTQTMTAGQIWLAMASVYIWLAKQRDENNA
jgi:hypothetical protein